MVLLHGTIILFLLFGAVLSGWIETCDRWLGQWLGALMGEEFVQALPDAVGWLIASVVAFGLPALILSCRHSWQRLTVWIASMVVLALWAPVLALAAHRPEISMAWLAAAVVGPLVTLHLYWIARKTSPES